MPVRYEQQRLPGRAKAPLISTRLRAEHVGARPMDGSALENCGEPSARVERNPAVLAIFGVLPRNANLMIGPIDAPVLDAQHLLQATAGFQRADEPVVHRRARVAMLSRVHLLAALEEDLLFRRQ